MNETSNKINIIDKVSGIIPLVLSFLVPVLFLTTTTEFYWFNKLTLIIISSVLLLVAWGLKILIGERVDFVKSKIDRSLLLFTLVAIISTFLSADKFSSLFGGYGRWTGLFAILAMVAFFFLSTPVIKSRKTINFILFGWMTGTTISTLLSILAYYGVFLGNSTFMSMRNFTLTGSVTDAIFLAAVSVVIGFSLIGYEKKIIKKALIIFSIIFNFFFVAIVGSTMGWVILIIGVLTSLWLAKKHHFTENRPFHLVLFASILLILMATFFPATREILVNPDFPREVTLPFNESWLISSSSMQQRPLFGTGLETFSLVFSIYRPTSLNYRNSWFFRFDKPFNEIFNIISSMGIVGVLVTILLASSLFKLMREANKDYNRDDSVRTVNSALVAVLAGFLLTYGTVTNLFLLFMLLVLLVATQALRTDSRNTDSMSVGLTSIASLDAAAQTGVVKKEYFRYIFSIPVFAFAIFVAIQHFNQYRGEYFMRKSILAVAANDGNNAYDYQRSAILANPRRSYYQNTYARTNLALANSIATKESLTDTDRQNIQTLIAQAIRSSKVTTEVLNPLDPVNWETRAFVYKNLINVAENAAEWAVQSYNSAIQLDPTNPRLRLELGGIYYSVGEYLSAANLFRQSTDLKNDYANGHFNFAQALIALEDYQSAKTALEITKILIAEGSDDMALINEQLELLAEKISTTESSSMPTVEELTGFEETTTQEPLENVADNQQLESENIDLGTLPAPEENTETPEVPEE